MLDKIMCYLMVASSTLVGFMAIYDGFNGQGKIWILVGCLALIIGGLTVILERKSNDC